MLIVSANLLDIEPGSVILVHFDSGDLHLNNEQGSDGHIHQCCAKLSGCLFGKAEAACANAIASFTPARFCQ